MHIRARDPICRVNDRSIIHIHGHLVLGPRPQNIFKCIL